MKDLFEGALARALSGGDEVFAGSFVLVAECGGLKDLEECIGELFSAYFSSRLCCQDEFLEVGLVVHVGTKENGNPVHHWFKNIVAADVGSVAAADNGGICDLVALGKQAHGVD